MTISDGTGRSSGEQAVMTVDDRQPKSAALRSRHATRPGALAGREQPGARGATRPTRGAEQAAASEPGVLLTGATGFLGVELLARYLERTDRLIYVLVRGSSERDVAARVKRALRGLFGPGHPYERRVVAVRGDLTRPHLGLGRRGEALVEGVGEIVHGAASVSFGNELETARAINVDGTQRVLELAERCEARCGLRRFTYISTAFVAGEHAGCFSEDDLDVGQRFRNSYEQSKFEAESLATSWRSRLPVTVVRPSIVVGERGTGWTASFNVLYWPLRAFARGAYAALPGRRSAPVDVVPVDYVADGILALSQAPEAASATFHLTAGRHVSSVGELVTLASAFFDRPAPQLIEPAVYRRMLYPLLLRAARDERVRRALQRSEVFFPYFAARVRYDDRRARAALHGTGIEPSPLRDYFEKLVEFALAAQWGKRETPRCGAVAPLWRAAGAGRPARAGQELARAG